MTWHDVCPLWIDKTFAALLTKSTNSGSRHQCFCPGVCEGGGGVGEALPYLPQTGTCL